MQVSAVMHRNSLGACKRLCGWTHLERHMTISTRRSVSSFWRNFWTVCFRLSLNACCVCRAVSSGRLWRRVFTCESRLEVSSSGPRASRTTSTTRGEAYRYINPSDMCVYTRV